MGRLEDLPLCPRKPLHWGAESCPPPTSTVSEEQTVAQTHSCSERLQYKSMRGAPLRCSCTSA